MIVRWTFWAQLTLELRLDARRGIAGLVAPFALLSPPSANPLRELMLLLRLLEYYLRKFDT